MDLIEKNNRRDASLNKDVGDRLKVFTANFDRKLGEMNEYIFNVVGKEVNKNIEQSAEIITKT